MYICSNCNSHKVKTRTNVSYGKTYSTPVNCKNCGSLSLKKVEKNSRRSFKRK